MFNKDNLWTMDQIGFVFLPDSKPDTWRIIDPTTDTEIGEYYELDSTVYTYADSAPDDKNEIIGAFQMFQDRPEYSVYRAHKLIHGLNTDSFSTLDDASDLYDTLIAGCAIMLYGEEYGLKHADSFLRWIRNTDFYQAPASAKYHDAFEGGLLKHSLDVAYHITDLLQLESFSTVNIASCILVALTHDLCKIGLYKPYLKNVKSEKTGQWEKERAYTYNDANIPLGHGAASLYITQKFFHLSLEEALAIRWHMGRWNMCDGEVGEYHVAVKKYPLVYMLQFADQLSIKEY